MLNNPRHDFAFQLDLAMHLTNYPVANEDDFNIDYGKNRTLDFLFEYLTEQKQDVSKFRKEIHVRLIPVSPSPCFSLLLGHYFEECLSR